MKQIRWVLLVLLLVSCTPAVEVEAPEPVTLSGVGTDSAVALIDQIGVEFVRQKPNLSIETDMANSNRALQRLAAGDADFALTTHNPEQDAYAPIPFARDGMALIVHPDNPVDNLTLIDLYNVYTGKITNWQDVQGARGDDEPIQVVVRERDSELGAQFAAQILPDDRITLHARVFPNSKAVADFVSQHPNTIGYVGTAYLSEAVKAVSVEEILPTRENLVNGAYPLTTLLYIVPPADADPLIDEFIRFALGPVGQSVVARNGFGRVN